MPALAKAVPCALITIDAFFLPLIASSLTEEAGRGCCSAGGGHTGNGAAR